MDEHLGRALAWHLQRAARRDLDRLCAADAGHLLPAAHELVRDPGLRRAYLATAVVLVALAVALPLLTQALPWLASVWLRGPWVVLMFWPALTRNPGT
jgi:hypothetical protein